MTKWIAELKQQQSGFYQNHERSKFSIFFAHASFPGNARLFPNDLAKIITRMKMFWTGRKRSAVMTTKTKKKKKIYFIIIRRRVLSSFFLPRHFDLKISGSDRIGFAKRHTFKVQEQTDLDLVLGRFSWVPFIMFRLCMYIRCYIAIPSDWGVSVSSE